MGKDTKKLTKTSGVFIKMVDRDTKTGWGLQPSLAIGCSGFRGHGAACGRDNQKEVWGGGY